LVSGRVASAPKIVAAENKRGGYSFSRDQIMSTSSDVFSSFRAATSSVATSTSSSVVDIMAGSPTSRMQPADSSSGSGAPTPVGSTSTYKVIQQTAGFAASSSTPLHHHHNHHHHHHHHHQCFDGSTADDEVTELPSCAYAARSNSSHMQHQHHYLNLAGKIIKFKYIQVHIVQTSKRKILKYISETKAFF
jgi:hypothetical protein